MAHHTTTTEDKAMTVKAGVKVTRRRTRNSLTEYLNDCVSGRLDEVDSAPMPVPPVVNNEKGD